MTAIPSRVVAFAATLFAATAAFAAPNDDTIPTSAGDVALHAIHHAALTLTWNGKTILVDPAPLGGNKDFAEFTALPAPDLILVTHEHPDHFNVAVLEAVSGKATIVAPQDVVDKLPADLKSKAKALAYGASLEVAGVRIDAVPAYNTTADRTKYHPEGRDDGFVLTIGDKRIYIAGDTEDTPEMRALTNIDVAFLPMNLPYTMDIAHAADAVKAFKPKVVYPYHYGQSDVEAFKSMVGDAADVRLLAWFPG
jgi:L-ascorbate metabolism protein UlaG (beta-lactamase superfamily)